MEIQFKKHVRVICDLNVGDVVFTEGFGYRLDGRDHVIEDIKYEKGCESSFIVKVHSYPRYIDSEWFNKR